MSDPTKRSEEERAREMLREQGEEISRLERLLSQHAQDAQSLSEIEEPAAPRERLFSRKVLVGWALAALFAVFIVRMVLPIAFDTAKESVVTALKESAGNTTVAAPAVPTAPMPPAAVIPTPVAPAPTAPSSNPAAPEAVRIHIKKVTR